MTQHRNEIRHFRTAKKEVVYLQLTPCRTVRLCHFCNNPILPGGKYINLRITPAAQPHKICLSCAKKNYPRVMEVLQ